MNTLITVLGALLDPASAPFVVSLVARWTILLSVAWVAHAALAGRNPRWRVALWRAVAIGAAAVPILACAPPVVRLRLPDADRSVISALVDRGGALHAVDVGNVFTARSSRGPAGRERPRVPDLERGPKASSRIASSGAAPERAIAGSGTGQSAGAEELLMSSPSRLGLWLLGIWAVGVMVLSVRYLRQVTLLGGIIGRSERIADEVVAGWNAVASKPTGLPAVHVRRSSEVHTPCLARAWRPVLLLPEQMCLGHDGAEMRAILAHELAHARGHDLAWNDALHLVSILLWFHPLVWRIRHAHASACDAVCDAVAADQLGDVATYSQALARLALRASGTLLAGGLAMARVSDVRRRIESLNRRVFRSPLSHRLAVTATLAFGLGVVLIGGLGFSPAAQSGSTKGQDAPAQSGRTAQEQEKTKPTQTALAGGPREKAELTTPAATLSASGTVVDAAGKPVAGATVILREWSVYRAREMGPKQGEGLLRGNELPDLLAETKADAAGRFQFDGVPAPGFPGVPEVGQSVFPWDLVALAPGHGLAWVQLTPHHRRTPITLTLGDEGTIRGRVVEPGGQPIARAKVKVFGVDPLGRVDVNGLGIDNRLNLIWSAFPLGARTGADGRFAIRGLPRDRVVTLVITDPGHERLIALAATTDAPQPENITSRISPSGTPYDLRQPVYTGDFALTAKRTDHVLTGRVVFEADGKPAAGTQILHSWEPLKAGADGRYRIEGLTSGPLELHAIAWGSEAAPLDLTIEIPEEPKQVERDLTLPRGLVVTGRVVDAATGSAVERATIDFAPRPEAGRKPTAFGFSGETDANGRFRLVVPPVRGTVNLRSVPPGFPPPQRQPFGETTDPRLSREVEGRGGQTVAVADFQLARARSVALRVVDPAGRPVENARVDVRDMNRWPRNEPGRTDAQGRYEAVGLAPGQVTVLDITADNPPLGATVEVEAEPAGGDSKTLDVQLQPLVSLSGRVLDEDGRPIAGPVIHLFRDVMYPGQSGRSFGLPVDTRTEVKPDGTYSFDRLIPGATYNTHVEADGHATATSKHVKIKPGQPARLEDFRLPATVQEVRGIVVDPRGKPIGGVTVAYERGDQTRALYAPTGLVWFQDTDALGRFHLTGLPRGPVRLMAYRRPDGADRAIQNMKYVDVRHGQAEVRIELPDPNDRLRGID